MAHACQVDMSTSGRRRRGMVDDIGSACPAISEFQELCRAGSDVCASWGQNEDLDVSRLGEGSAVAENASGGSVDLTRATLRIRLSLIHRFVSTSCVQARRHVCNYTTDNIAEYSACKHVGEHIQRFWDVLYRWFATLRRGWTAL